MAENFPRKSGEITSPAGDAFVVSTSDTVNSAAAARSLYVGVSGNVNALMISNTSVHFPNVPVGVLPIRFIRINATGTTANGMIGLV